mmetsp:Transcript_10554/g.24981  ORF Transcript_10554/g.24981 Transcript_10554/m.24981 type:complete len:100 (-) Transcript_10554:2516-2815(-)
MERFLFATHLPTATAIDSALLAQSRMQLETSSAAALLPAQLPSALSPVLGFWATDRSRNPDAQVKDPGGWEGGGRDSTAKGHPHLTEAYTTSPLPLFFP